MALKSNINRKKTDEININCENHIKLIKLIEKSNLLFAKIIKRCDIKVYNDEIVSLCFDSETIYSIYAEKNKKQLEDLFTYIINKPIIIEISITKNEKKLELETILNNKGTQNEKIEQK